MEISTTNIKDNNEKNSTTIPPLTTCPRCNEETYLLMLERKEKKMCRASERKNEAKIKRKKSNSI